MGTLYKEDIIYSLEKDNTNLKKQIETFEHKMHVLTNKIDQLEESKPYSE